MEVKAVTVDPTQVAIDKAATQIMGLADKFMLHMGMTPGDVASQTNQTRCMAMAVEVLGMRYMMVKYETSNRPVVLGSVVRAREPVLEGDRNLEI